MKCAAGVAELPANVLIKRSSLVPRGTTTD